jgi:hypothetical protein
MLLRLMCQAAVFSLISIAVIGGAAAQENAERNTVREINQKIKDNLSAGTIGALAGQEFIVLPSQDAKIIKVSVSPAGAFEAPQEKPDGSWVIRIKDPSLLYRLDAGIKVPVAVRVSIERDFGDQATFQLDASSACINILVYTQVGGGEVNLEELLSHPGYETKLDYPADLLKQREIRGTHVTFERIRSGPAAVALRVRSLETDTVQEITNVIPECGISSEPVTPEPLPVQPVQPVAPSPLPEVVTVTQPSQTWASLEASIGIAGRVAFDVSHHVGGPLLTWGLFGDYSFIDLGPRHEKSQLIFGLRAGAGWRWADMSLLAQFPLALTQGTRQLRFGTEVVFEKNLRNNLDGRITAGAMMVEEGDAEILLLAGVTLHFGRASENESGYE